MTIDERLRQVVEIINRFEDCKDSDEELEVIHSLTEWVREVDKPMLTAAEEQRRGFVHGNVSISNPDVTREVVDRIADDMGRTLASIVPEGKVTRNLHDDPIILAAAADALRKADGRPPWGTDNLPGNDVMRVRQVLVVVDAYLEEKGR